MKAKEKAVELVERFKNVEFWDTRVNRIQMSEAKQCAIICVDELISAFKQLSIEDSGTVFRDFGHGYWSEVKTEIEKL